MADKSTIPVNTRLLKSLKRILQAEGKLMGLALGPYIRYLICTHPERRKGKK